MKVQVQSLQVPRWVVPVMVVIALALVPFALMLALVVGGIALGATALRVLTLPGSRPVIGSRPLGIRGEKGSENSPVIDADYEIKDENVPRHNKD